MFLPSPQLDLLHQLPRPLLARNHLEAVQRRHLQSQRLLFGYLLPSTTALRHRRPVGSLLRLVSGATYQLPVQVTPSLERIQHVGVPLSVSFGYS